MTEQTAAKTARPPNKQQKECIENNERKYLVIAGPGTGKTYTISEKIKYLVEQRKINPERILCLTFSETGANEMRDRAAKDYHINVRTFHGFCLDIILNYADEFNFPSIDIISDSNVRAILNECIEELHKQEKLEGYNNAKRNPFVFADEIRKGIEEIKKARMHISLDDAEDDIAKNIKNLLHNDHLRNYVMYYNRKTQISIQFYAFFYIKLVK